MSTAFSEIVKQFVTDGSIDAIPNPAQSGYLCMPTDFLSELIRFVSMMQVLHVGVGNEVAAIKNDLKKSNQSFAATQSHDLLYNMMVRAIHRIGDICVAEGEHAMAIGETKLAETYAWSMAGCSLFLDYMESTRH